MRRGLVIPFLLSLLLSLSVFGSVAQEASPASGTGPLAEMGFPELAISTDGTTSDLPAELEAGRYLLSVTNTSSDLNVDVELIQLPDGVTPDDLLAAFMSDDLPEWFHDTAFGGGVSSVMPGATTSAVLDITPGEWTINVHGYSDDYSVDNNMPTTVTVTGDMPMVEDPESAVTASMVDYDFEITQPVPAGANVWHLQNTGTEPHHMVVFGVPDGATEDQVLDAFMAFFGPPASPEAMASPAAAGLNPDDIQELFGTVIFSTDSSVWTEYDLAPGTYAAVCFLPTPDGVPHIMMGMIEVFTVD